MRVLIVINRIGAQGGAERSTREIVGGLHGEGVDFSLFVLWPDTNPAVHEELHRAGVQVTVSPPGFIHRVRALRRTIKSVRPHVVHSVLFDADVASRAATAFGRVPNVCSLVNTQYDRQAMKSARSKWKLELARAIDLVSGRLFVDRFHTISQAVGAHAGERLKVPADRLVLVPRGRDIDRLGERSDSRRNAVRLSMAVPAAAPVLISLGRQQPQKGQIDLLRAMPTILEQKPDCILWIVGREGASTPDLESEVGRLRLSNSVGFLGVRDDVGDLLAAADVFVFPSHWEGLGGALIEALAMKLPIVASDLPAVREVVSDHARLVGVGDHRALAEAVLETLGHPTAAAQRCEAGYRRFVEQFGKQAMLDGMLNLYRGTAGLPAPVGPAR